MKKLSLLVTIIMVMFLFSCQPPIREVEQYTIEQFMDNVRIIGKSFSINEKKILYSSNESGIYNAYELNLETGEKKQLTQRDESTFITGYLDESERILIYSDKEGNEISHIYIRNIDGTIEDLIPFEGARVNFFGWSYDRKSFFFQSNNRDSRYSDLYEMNIQDMTYKMIYENKEGYDLGDISIDKNWLSLSKTITRSNSDMYLLNLKTNEIEHLSEHEGDIVYRPLDFSGDSKFLYYLNDENSEFTYLVKMNLESGEKEKIYDAGWDIMYAYHTYNEKYRIMGINQDSKTVIKVFDMNTGEEINLPNFEGLDITSVSVSRSENFMAFNASSSRETSNLYIYDFTTNDFKQLTNTLNPEINIDNLVDGKIIRYKSFDGLEIPAVLYMPYNATVKNKVPALVHVHGGPGGQARIGYRSHIQYLVNHGYAIIDVNNRGSSGYGKTFYSLDDRKHGDHDLKDCIYAKSFLTETGLVDPEKIGIIGGSYGGYMTAAALTFAPEEFAVGINLFGVTNWLRTLKSIPSWWESYRNALYKELGDPFKDSTYLYEISPLFHADKIVKPFMVLQGANDPRVLQAESDEIVNAARKNGVPVEYVLFEDEGHGFRKKENQIKSWEKILTFLDMYLKNPE
ncbi:MAG: prolyl oligopeptidase family serine peptidase [Bacteroidales bacterium]|jgi:dipeptidyl aminopeptidase/acylaminoacyl peptidase|nr:prolyl oligopeptidase family serine peptidase [Bacteroidales bacterium]